MHFKNWLGGIKFRVRGIIPKNLKKFERAISEKSKHKMRKEKKKTEDPKKKRKEKKSKHYEINTKYVPNSHLR